MLFDVFF